MRKGQWAVLHGTWHIAPFPFYEYLQWEIDLAEEDGRLIFREGIITDDLPPPASLDDKAIRNFWMHWFESYEEEARIKEWQLERDFLKYPKGAIIADIPLDVMSHLLSKKGFRCKTLSLLLWFLSKPTKRKLVETIESAIEVAKGKDLKFWNWRKKMWMKLLAPMGQKLYTVVLLDRNHVAMDIIRHHDDGRDIFLTYGDAHISGLVNLFLQDGWVVESTRKIDPEMVNQPIIISPNVLNLPRPDGVEVEVETEEETV